STSTHAVWCVCIGFRDSRLESKVFVNRAVQRPIAAVVLALAGHPVHHPRDNETVLRVREADGRLIPPVAEGAGRGVRAEAVGLRLVLTALRVDDETQAPVNDG